MTTTKTPADALADLHEARAALLDPLDVPRTWTQRQVNDYEARRRLLNLHCHGLQGEQEAIARCIARRAPLQASLDRLRTAETQLHDPASLRALHRGAEYVNGEPALPGPLQAFLTDTCPTCGHAALHWPGPIGSLEEEIAGLDKQIAEHQMLLDSHLAGAAAWLAEPVEAR